MNNKGRVFSSVIIILFFIGVRPVMAAEHVEFTEDHTFKNEVSEELIEVWAYDESYDYDEAQAMIDRIGEIPERIVQSTLNNQAKLLFIDFPLVEIEEYAYLAGEVPRGWEGRGYTWDDVPGIGGLTTVARIGMSEPGELHNATNLEYHEYGHTIDSYLFNYKLSNTEEFVELFTTEKQSLFGDDAYFDYAEEYFAESISLYFLGGDHKERLRENAPETYAFFDTLEESILTVESNDEHGVVFSWEPIEGAALYEVYRDHEKIDEIDSLTFTDTSLDDYANHLYYVQAVNEEGESIHKTFSEDVPTTQLATIETPTQFDAVLENDVIMLTWNESDMAEKYEVIRNNEEVARITDLSYIDEDVKAGDTYSYTVRAISDLGMSDDAPEVEITMEKDAETTNSSVYVYALLGFVGCLLLILWPVIQKKE